MIECRMCGEPTDSSTLLCDGCAEDMRADDAAREASRKGFQHTPIDSDQQSGLTLIRFPIDGRGPVLLADLKKRCPTCGRMDNCCCGPDCEYCIGGKPKASAMKWSQ